MARPSNRVAVIEAVMRVAEEQGLSAVTIDSVALAAGMTKGGVLYHFPSRQALVSGVYEHVAQEWEAELVAAAGKTAEEATDRERFTAYIRVARRPMTRAELVFVADGGADPELVAPFAEVTARWAPSTATPDADGDYSDEALRLLIARMAADGLWSYEVLSGEKLPDPLRRHIAEQIADSLDG